MAKRKIDSSLDGIILNYLKKAKCEKTLKLFEGRLVETREDKDTSKKFWNHLKRKEDEKEIAKDDLGFEINSGAYQSQAGESRFSSSRTPEGKSSAGPKKRNEKSEKKEKVDIPKEFIEKIRKLGMKMEDTEALYKSKIDWTAVYSNNKIYCTELTCDYSTKIDDGDLTNHMIDVHKYGEYNCDDPHCNYVGYSKKTLTRHNKMHTTIPNKSLWIKCPKPNCEQTFVNDWKLNVHLRVHNNELDRCQYCPYRYVRQDHYQTHLKQHFGIADFKCDQCDKEFSTIAKLNAHYGLHEGIHYCCLICNSYEAKQKKVMSNHIRRNHPEIFEKRRNWEDLQQFTKMKW